MTVDDIIAGVIDREGGFVDHPKDRGGPTMWGITKRTLEAWRGRQVTDAEVRNLSMDEAAAIYRRVFIEKPGFLAVENSELRALLVDYGVNSGPSDAVRALQRALGVVVDGQIGPETRAALVRANEVSVYRAVLADRLLHWMSCIAADSHQIAFAQGWIARFMAFVPVLLLAILGVMPAAAATPTSLQGRASQGQVFVTFNEVAGTGITYRIYRNVAPIASVTGLTPVATVPQNSGLNLYTGQRFIVTDLGSPLASGVGFFVYTSPADGAFYYAVTTSQDATITAGVYALMTPVQERAAPVPGAVQLNPAHDCGGHTCVSYMAWEDAATWPAAWGGYGRRFDVAIVVTRQPGQSYPLILDLHGAGASIYQEPNPFVDAAFQGIYVFPVDLSFAFGFTDPYSGTGQLPTAWFGYPSGSLAMRATERRVVRYARWIASLPEYQVDPTRIYVKGGSMGGGGALHVAMHYPDVFAAAAASIAWIGPQDWGNMWSQFAAGARVDAPGGPVFTDYLDGDLLASQTAPIPPIVHTFRKDDSVIPQTRYPAFLTHLEQHQRAYAAEWQPGGHAVFWHDGSGDPWSLTRFRRDESYPAFANASISDSVNAPTTGQRNLTLDWSSSLHSLGANSAIRDDASGLAMSFASLAGDATATVTILNAQQFHPTAGQAVQWTNVGPGLAESGMATADARGLVSLPVRILAAGNRLTLTTAVAPPPPPPATVTQFNIPNFCQTATITAVASGNWNAATTWMPARVPQAGDVVNIPAGKTVTLTDQQTAKLACVGVDGTFAVLPTANTRLTFVTFMVFTGTVTVSPDASHTAEFVVADHPLDEANDPEHYGNGILVVGGVFTVVGRTITPTFLRLTGEPRAGQTTLALTGSTNWRVGDTIVIPGTNQWNLDAGIYAAQWEERTLSAVNGATLTTDRLGFDHGGAHDQDGALVDTADVGDLTRNVIFRSENPNGTRGHVLLTGRAAVDIRYALFKELGRTTVVPLDPKTNTKGRYALHAHYLLGPATTPTNGYQFTLIGNVVRDATKWGITVHHSHYGLVQDNVVFNVQGSSFMTEDGSEVGNLFKHNLGVVALGPGDGGYGTLAGWANGGAERGDLRGLYTDIGYEGTCFWLRGPGNAIEDNTCANTNGFAYTLIASKLGDLMIPAFKGADPMAPGGGIMQNMQQVPIPSWTNNRNYATADGITIWDVGSNCCTRVYPGIEQSVIKNHRQWHIGRYGTYGYAWNNVTFDGYEIFNETDLFYSCCYYSTGWWTGDYISRNTVIRNANIQGMKTGIQAPFKVGDPADGYGASVPGTLLIANSTFRNEWNVVSSPMYAVTGGGTNLVHRIVTVDHVRFGALNTSNVNGEPCNICMSSHLDSRNGNILQKDELIVRAYNGVGGDDFQAYYKEQAPTYVVPASADGLTGAPMAGLTNTQLWQQFGLAYAGAIAPCSATRALVDGFACPLATGGHPAPRAPLTGPVPTP